MADDTNDLSLKEQVMARLFVLREELAAADEDAEMMVFEHCADDLIELIEAPARPGITKTR
jgi:hypothetical protein